MDAWCNNRKWWYNIKTIGEIIILNKDEDLEPEEEMVKDVLQIMNVFTAKMNGLRKYKVFIY